MLLFALKYVVLPLVGILLAYQANDPDGKHLPNWLKAKRTGVRHLFLSCAVMSVIVGAFIAWNDEKDAARDREDMQLRIDDMKVKMAEDGTTLETTREELRVTTSLLSQANSNLIAQSRSIGSLILNGKTSYEGNRKFMDEFKKIFLALDPENEKITVRDLDCEEGLAVYFFSRQGELTGFHFFPNSELNDALAGLSLEMSAYRSAAPFVIPTESTVSKALNKMMFRETPTLSSDEVERRLAKEKVHDLIECVCRYVYRAETFSFSHRDDGLVFLSFTYYANPNNEKYFQHVELLLTEGDVAGLYGVRLPEFVSRLLKMFRAKGVEPKVTSNDIGQLQSSAMFRAHRKNSPFRDVSK